MGSKFYWAYTLLFFLGSILNAQNYNEVVEKIRAKNGISEMITYKVDVSTGDSLLIDHNWYRPDGQLLKDVRYNDEGTERYRYDLTYDENGFLKEQKGYKFGELSTVLSYVYDKVGNRTQNLQHSPDGKLLIHQKRIFDEKGQNTELYNRNRDNGTFYKAATYEYNSEGKYSRTYYYNDAEQLVRISESKHQRTKKGYRVKIYETLGNQRRSLILINSYNDQGLILERNRLSRKERLVYTYDNDGNLIEEVSYSNDIPSSMLKYVYSKFGE